MFKLYTGTLSEGVGVRCVAQKQKIQRKPGIQFSDAQINNVVFKLN